MLDFFRRSIWYTLKVLGPISRQEFPTPPLKVKSEKVVGDHKRKISKMCSKEASLSQFQMRKAVGIYTKPILKVLCENLGGAVRKDKILVSVDVYKTSHEKLCKSECLISLDEAWFRVEFFSRKFITSTIWRNSAISHLD